MKSGILLLVLALCATAQGYAVTCATFITADLALTNDLIDCPDQGLIVSSVGPIVIKLNGHTISGRPGSTVGIGVTYSTGVVIVGPGVVTGFTTGLTVSDSDSVHVENLEFVGNTANNLLVRDGFDILIQGSTMSHGTNGVLITGPDAHSIRILNNQIVNNSGSGILLNGVSLNQVSDNYVKGNGLGLRLSSADENVVTDNAFVTNTSGIKLDATTPGAGGADRNRIERNKFLYNVTGVVAEAGPASPGRNRYNRIEYNELYDGDRGINVDGPKNIKTRVRYNKIVRMPVAYIMDTGTSTVVAGNTCSPGPC